MDETGGYCPKCDTVWAAQENVSNKINNVYAREVWNEAIEVAARCVHNEVDADQIRKLKK